RPWPSCPETDAGRFADLPWFPRVMFSGLSHVFRIPADRPIFEVAGVRKERRSGGPEAKGAVFDHPPSRAHRLEEVAEVVQPVVVARRGLIDHLLRFRDLTLRRIFGPERFE